MWLGTGTKVPHSVNLCLIAAVGAGERETLNSGAESPLNAWGIVGAGLTGVCTKVNSRLSPADGN